MSVCPVCLGVLNVKKTEQIPVHMSPSRKAYCVAKADILNISNSEFVESLIAKSQIEDERHFHIMKKVHDSQET